MIFFDIDGTLLNHERAEKMGAMDFFKGNTDDLHLSENQFIRLWNTLSDKYFEKFLAKELSFQEQRRKRIKELFGHPLSNEQADNKFNDYLSLYKRNWVAFEDVAPCLKLLKQSGHRLGIISNGDYTQQIEKLNRLGIKEYFEIIVTSSNLGVAKPDANIFLGACKQGNIRVEESYYIGDRLETDAIGSRNAGMKGIWINRKDKTYHPDIIVIHSLSELKELVN